MGRSRRVLTAAGALAAGWVAFCRPTPVNGALALYAPGIALGDDVGGAAPARYRLAFRDYFGYQDTTYRGPDGTRRLGLAVPELGLVESAPATVEGAIGAVWLEAPTPAAAAAVERRLTRMLGRPAVTCSRDPDPAPQYRVPYRYVSWKPFFRPGVLLMVPRAAWTSSVPGASAPRPESALLVFGETLPDARFTPTGPCAAQAAGHPDAPA